MKQDNIADGMSYPTLVPYICLRGAADAIEFYKKAFGAEEVMCQADPDGKVRHAEVRIGESVLMIHDEFPEFSQMKSVQAQGGSPVHLFASFADVDAVYGQAVEAGVKAMGPLEDKPYGRTAGVVDPFGLTWWLCSKG